MISGYDFDGVVTDGYIPSFGDVIITGRSYQEAQEVLLYLRLLNISCPVYFNPVKLDDNSLALSGLWKADMINALGLDRFYEDNQIQADIIAEKCNVDVVFVG